jgi:hypothetical protein
MSVESGALTAATPISARMGRTTHHTRQDTAQPHRRDSQSTSHLRGRAIVRAPLPQSYQ